MKSSVSIIPRKLTKNLALFIDAPVKLLVLSLLKEILKEVSQVPDEVKYIPEIVINGLNEKVLRNGMKIGIEALIDFEDVLYVSAGNYQGKLGEYKINLLELFK